MPATPRPRPSAATRAGGDRSPADATARVAAARELYRLGRTADAAAALERCDNWTSDAATLVDALLLRGMALYEAGDVASAFLTMRGAFDAARREPPLVRFNAAFALFVRQADLQAPDETVAEVARLRQLAADVADVRSLAGLHLAVARLEGVRGHFVDAHEHIGIARELVTRIDDPAMACLVSLIEASVEASTGNTVRSARLTRDAMNAAEALRDRRYRLHAKSLLAISAVHAGELEQAAALVDETLADSDGLIHVRLAALDTRAQIELTRGDLDACAASLDDAARLASVNTHPRRLWNDLEADLTRLSLAERRERWDDVIAIADAADPELNLRRLTSLRCALVAGKARALSRLGHHRDAEATLSIARRTCPRGALDQLIVIEASRAVCLSHRGRSDQASAGIDRALRAARAIGHRQHETWIASLRDSDAGLAPRPPASVASDPAASPDTLQTADVEAVLGAGHSVDLLINQALDIIRRTPLGDRVRLVSRGGLPNEPRPRCSWRADADGSFQLTLRGSDQQLDLVIDDVQSLEELSFARTIGDVLRAAISLATEISREDDTDNLWPDSVGTDDEDVVFRSPRMVELVRIASRLATTDLPVLITGETGTGKEVLARLIHDRSASASGPFVPFNCSAIPRELVESQLFGHRRGAFTGAVDSFPGVIRAAEHGTLFLDEIGDLDATMQPKLLRFIESGEVHPVGEVRARQVTVRIVAATNADLESMTASGRFRSDLFYRIGVTTIELPPLRERKDEIPALSQLFLRRYAAECGRTGVSLSDDCLAALLMYDWPGNIRQLGNEIRRAVAMASDGDVLRSRDLAPAVTESWNARTAADVVEPADPTVGVRLNQPLASAVAELEEQFIAHALDATGGRVSDAARLLGLSRKGLFLKRRRRGLGPDEGSVGGNGSTQS